MQIADRACRFQHHDQDVRLNRRDTRCSRRFVAGHGMLRRCRHRRRRPALLELARTAIDHLEQCWSRFRPGQRHQPPEPRRRVDDRPRRPGDGGSVRAMVDGWRATAGAFDPTLLAPLVGLGYAASWHDPAAVTSVPHGARPRARSRPSCGSMPIATSSFLPSGMCLDAGGIGKGLAADLVVEQLLDAGAAGASVSIGGDVAVRGTAPQEGGWLVGVADPVNDEQRSRPTDVARRWRGDLGHASSARGATATASRYTTCSIRRRVDPIGITRARSSRSLSSPAPQGGPRCGRRQRWCVGGAALADLDQLGLGAQFTYADGTTATNRVLVRLRRATRAAARPRWR